MFELHWIIAANIRAWRISKCRFSFFFGRGANFHILLPFTSLLLGSLKSLEDFSSSSSPSSSLKVNQQPHIFLPSNITEKIQATAEAHFEFMSKLRFRARRDEIQARHGCVRLFLIFVALMLLFMPERWKNIDKQTNDERFVLRSEVLLTKISLPQFGFCVDVSMKFTENREIGARSDKAKTEKSFQEHTAQRISLNFNYVSVSFIDFSADFHLLAGVFCFFFRSTRTFKMTKSTQELRVSSTSLREMKKKCNFRLNWK